HMVRHTTDRARERLASVQNGLQPALSNIRAWPRATKIKVGASVAAIALFVGGLAVRGKTPAPVPERPAVRTADIRPAPAEKKQARARFKDEPKSPGIFSCSSRRAAQKALERQARG